MQTRDMQTAKSPITYTRSNLRGSSVVEH